MTLRSPTLQRFCLGLVLLGTTGTAFAQAAPPNIHFIVDTSSSMRELPQIVAGGHAEFFDLTTNGCNNPRLDAMEASRGWNPNTVYPVPDTGTGIGSDTGFPDLFRDDKFYMYMGWSDLSAPSYDWNTKEEACQSQVPNWNTSGVAEYNRCLQCLNTKGYYKVPGAEGSDYPPYENLDFIFWGRFLNFNPPKYVTVKAELKKLLKTLQGKRVGITQFAPNSNPALSQLMYRQKPSCDQAALYPTTAFDSYRASYINSINSLQFITNTPLARTLLNVGYYFSSGNDVYQTQFGFGSNYSYPSSFQNDPLTSQGRSVCWSCQTNAVIIISDGEPSSDNVSPTLANALRNRNWGPVYCPDSKPCSLLPDPSNPFYPYYLDKGLDPADPSDDNLQYLLDDVAKLLNNQDLQQASPAQVGSFDTSGQQSLKIYAIGYGVSSNLFKNTAAVGGGLSFATSDGAALRQALQATISDIEAHSASCSIP